MSDTAPGPFYDLTDEQWREVRSNHERFIDGTLGRPLIFGLWANPDGGGAEEDEPIRLAGPHARIPEADADIFSCVRSAKAMRGCASLRDSFPAIRPARNLHGHSQRLAEPFGAEPFMDAGHCQSRPSITSMAQVRHLRPRPARDCHWLSRSLELMRYYYESSEGRYPIGQMVTTGPIDTVNYATGTTLLLESLYTHPKEVHALLRMAVIYHERLKDSPSALATWQEIVRQFGGTAVAEDALWRIAQYHERARKHAEAIVAYKTFLRNYRPSAKAGAGQFAIAENHEHLGEWIKAMDAYKNYQTNFPKGPMGRKAKEQIIWIKTYRL